MPKKAPVPVPLEHRLMKAALTYAERGWRVLPLRPGTKIPIHESWQIEASTDPDLIRSWWVDNPRANVGIATGSASGLLVLDVDTKKGKRGAKSLRKLEKAHGALPDTYTAETASGGLHYYFRYPKGEGTWRNSASTLAPDLDIRAEGGQVAAWPSVIREYGGASYEVLLDPGKPAKMPEWLKVATRYVEPQAPTRPAVDPASLSDADKERSARWVIGTINGVVEDLRALAEAAVPEGQEYRGQPWDNGTYQAACRLAELASTAWTATTDEEAHAILLDNAPRDRGFTDRRVEDIWRSAIKKTAGKQLPIPTSVSGGLVLPFPESSGSVEPSSTKDVARYFDGKELLAERLANAIGDELALGIDGEINAFRGGVWSRDPDELKRRTTRLLRDKYRPAYLSAATDIVVTSDLPHLSGEPNGDFLNLRSGMLEWRTGVLVPHDPSHLSTIQLPVEYDPEAGCSHFDRFLADALPADSIKLAWEMIGYALMEGNPLQCAFLFVGEGGNGKGTLLRVLSAVMGKWNISNVSLRSISEGKFEVAGMQGKLANIAGDIDSQYLRDTSMFKSITGGDAINAQHKHGRPFDFTAWALPIFSANEMWRSADTTEGYFRRWVPLSFPNRMSGKFDERKLYAEAPGIVNKAIIALRRLMARGEWELGLSSSLLLAEFKQEADIVRTWLAEDDSLVIADRDAQDNVVWAPRAALHRSFAEWSRGSDHGTLSTTKFYKRLRALGYDESRRSAGYGFYGIRPIRMLAGQPTGQHERDLPD